MILYVNMTGDLNEPQDLFCGDKVSQRGLEVHMKKLPLCLTAVICFSLLNVATADPLGDCFRLGNNEQYREALPFCQEACDLNDGFGCSGLGWFYSEGKGVRQDYQQAKTYYEKACNLNDDVGCFNLGLFYEKGQGVRQDYQQAKTYYEKACNLNDDVGCFNLGVFYANGQGVRQNFQTAKEYFGKACDLGEQKGCDAYRELNEKGY